MLRRPRVGLPARLLPHDERGLSTVEYIIILALVAIVGFVVWQQFGGHAAESNRAAGHVVNGLATSSHEGDHAATTGGAPAAPVAAPLSGGRDGTRPAARAR
jgi:hypothetical protein